MPKAAAMRAPTLVGMVQLRPLPGSPRYTGDPVDNIVEDVLNETSTLANAGFDGIQLQNMGDNPSSRRAGLQTVAFMTRACVAVHSNFPKLQLSVLVNWDAEASLAVAAAVDADYVRVEHTWVGASVTSWGISDAQCHTATTFRSRIASSTPIYADVLEPHAVPLVERPVEYWARAAVEEGAADGLFITGRSFDESVDWLRRVRSTVPGVPLWLGGGVNAENVRRVVGLVDGMTVATSIKHGDMANRIDPELASAFVRAARALPPEADVEDG